jgi:hypothetical protein
LWFSLAVPAQARNSAAPAFAGDYSVHLEGWTLNREGAVVAVTILAQLSVTREGTATGWYAMEFQGGLHHEGTYECSVFPDQVRPGIGLRFTGDRRRSPPVLSTRFKPGF